MRRWGGPRRRGGASASGAALALAVALLGAACGSADLPGSVASSTVASPTTLGPADLEAALDPTCVAAATIPSGSTVESVEVSGVTRTYLQTIPISYEGVSMPVVVSLHNTGATAAQQDETSGLRAAADADGFVLLTPQGLGQPPAWDVAPDSADLGFLDAMLEQAAQDFCFDPARVYVVGHGDGSSFAARVACDRAAEVAAVAFIGDVVDPDPCEQQRPVPLVVLPGFEGNVDPWATRYGCDATPREETVEAGATGTGSLAASVYEGCEEGAALETLPQADQALLNDAVWSFFAAHPLTAAP